MAQRPPGSRASPYQPPRPERPRHRRSHRILDRDRQPDAGRDAGAPPAAGRTRPCPRCRFCSADRDGKTVHPHDSVALVESPNVPAPADWELAGGSVAVNHIAMQLPDREAWLKQLEFLQSRGIKFNWRVNHGVTHSVYVNDPNGYGVEFLYELPREMWENDIQGAIDYLENLPTDGPEALVDRTDSPSFGQKQQPSPGAGEMSPDVTKKRSAAVEPPRPRLGQLEIKPPHIPSAPPRPCRNRTRPCRHAGRRRIAATGRRERPRPAGGSSYLILAFSSLATVAGRSVAVKAMWSMTRRAPR